MGEAGEAGHAAGVMVPQALEQLPQLLPAFLVLQEPLLLILRCQSGGREKTEMIHELEWP